MRLRAGVIGSSGGSTLRAAVAIARSAAIQVDLTVVTDRDCGLEQWARHSGYQTTRIEYVDARDFSAAAMTVFQERQIEDVLLFYVRRIADPLVSQLRVSNIDLSLPSTSSARADTLGYTQRVYLTLAWFDRLTAPILPMPTVSPNLSRAISNAKVSLSNGALLDAYAKWIDSVVSPEVIAA